jgi:hypothetical protein
MTGTGQILKRGAPTHDYLRNFYFNKGDPL